MVLAMGIFILGSIYADDFAVPRNVGGFAVVFLGAVAFAVVFAVAVAEVRSSNPMVVCLFYCGVLLAILVMAIKMPDDFGAGQRNRAVFAMLTFGLLPLFNAVFDFLSAGLTRYLLRLGLE